MFANISLGQLLVSLGMAECTAVHVSIALHAYDHGKFKVLVSLQKDLEMN